MTDTEDAAVAHRVRVAELFSDPQTLVVYTDGSQLRVQGSRELVCGLGIAAYHMGDPVLELAVGFGTTAEVYDTEMAALARAAASTTELIRTQHDRGRVTRIYFFADSTAAVDTILQEKARPGQFWSVSFRYVIFAFLDAHPDHYVEVGWVPGHENVRGNERSDDLAKMGAGPSEVGFWYSTAHARRQAKAAIRQSWTEAWAASLLGGGYAIANRRKPTFEPPDHFKTLPRELYSRVTQCRTGHAFIGEYYRRFVPTEETACLCGQDPQTRYHILKECVLYRRWSREIIDMQLGEDWRMADLLGTPKGIVILAEFLLASGAYSKIGGI